MDYAPDYWSKQDWLTTKEIAILYVGGDPLKNRRSQRDQHSLLDIERRLSSELKLSVKLAKDLLKSGRTQFYQDENNVIDTFEKAFNDEGAWFYESISKDRFAALDEETYPTIQDIKLSKKAVKRWLESNDKTSSLYFFPDQYIPTKPKRLSKQKLRELVLADLIDEVGIDQVNKNHLETWNLLRERDEKLFHPQSENNKETAKKFFLAQTLIPEFREGRPPKNR